MLGIAIIGAGDIANTHIEAYLKLHERCTILAVADIYQDKAQEKIDKYGLHCPAVKDYHDLLTRDDIQLISVCLPPSLHCAVSVDFLRAGKHVLCEKPMAPTLEECDSMLEAAAQGQAELSVVVQNRFKPDIMRTKQFIDSGVLGELYACLATSLWWRGDHYYELWWRGTWEKEGGGCTFIHAVHHLDLLLWLMGEVSEVRAFLSNQAHRNSEVEDISMASIRFAGGGVGSLVSSLVHHGEEQKIILDAQHATVELPHKIVVSKQKDNGYPEPDEAAQQRLEAAFQALPELTCTEHYGQIENMVRALERGEKPLVSGVDGRRTVELVSGIYQSAFTDTVTRFPLTRKDLFYTRQGILSKVVKFYDKKKSVENFADQGIPVGGTL